MGLAVVTFAGRDHYLGKRGTPESRAEYDRLVREWLNAGRALPAAAGDLTVIEMLLRNRAFAETDYRKPDGPPTGERRAIREARKPLRRLHGHTLASAYGPRSRGEDGGIGPSRVPEGPDGGSTVAPSIARARDRAGLGASRPW